MKDNSKLYNKFINSIADETIRTQFYKSTFQDSTKWGNCAILEIVKNIPYQKIEDDEKFKKFFYSSPELSILKLKDDDFLKKLDDDWERLLNTYTTNKKIVVSKENEFLDELLENDKLESEDDLEEKICSEIEDEIRLQKQYEEEKTNTEGQFMILANKMKDFFEKYTDKEEELNDEDIDRIFSGMHEDDKIIYTELQKEFEDLMNKLNNLEEHGPPLPVEKKEDVEDLKNIQSNFLCFLETANKLHPERFRFY